MSYDVDSLVVVYFHMFVVRAGVCSVASSGFENAVAIKTVYTSWPWERYS